MTSYRNARPCLFTLTLLACMLTGLPGRAQQVVLAPAGAVIPYGEKAEYTFTPPPHRSARLLLSVRMDCPDCAGSTHVLRLALNGQPVRGALDRAHMRLLNKPMVGRMASGVEVPWVRDADWRVVYAPDFKILDSAEGGSARIVNGSAYRLVLDVSDLVRPAQPNHLTVEHLGKSINLRSYHSGHPSLDLVFEQLAMEFTQEAPVQTAAAREVAFSADRLMVQPPATSNVPHVVSVAPGGALRLGLPGLPLHLESRFSYPGGGFNTFGLKPAPPGQPGWQVRVQHSGGTMQMMGQAPEYRVQRQVRLAKDHVEVTDTLTNLTGSDLGVAFDNRVVCDGPPVARAWLGGNPDPAMTSISGRENSSVFVAGEKAGCGLLALDDVYRVQGVFYYDDGAGARSDTFALAPHATYQVRFSIYPVLRPDYYDFINLARRDLDVNFTVPGGFQFGLPQATPQSYADSAAVRGLRFISSGVWFSKDGPFKCYQGEHMLQATALQQKFKDACADIRRVAPQVQSLIYIHCFINTDPAGPAKYPDSRVTNPDGTHFEDKEYTRQTGTPFLYYYPAVAPANSYMAAMKRVVDMVLDKDKIGADGIYWDELEITSPQYTSDRWDGHTALLDAQHRIIRKMASLQLLSAAAKAELYQYIVSKGGVVIGNSSPMTDTFTKIHFPRFVETAAEWYPARAHLYTPIALGDHLTVTDLPTLVADIRKKLMWGGLYYYYASPLQPYSTITRHMFPFTPVELHRGWLLGRERILTAVPGTFTFGDAKAVKVFWYDSAGRLKDSQGAQSMQQQRRLVRLALQKDEMAVIERAGGAGN